MTNPAKIAGSEATEKAAAAARIYLAAIAEALAEMIPPGPPCSRGQATIGSAAFAMLINESAKANGLEAAGFHIGQGIGQAVAQMPGFAPVVFMGSISEGIQMGEALSRESFAPPNATRQ